MTKPSTRGPTFTIIAVLLCVIALVGIIALLLPMQKGSRPVPTEQPPSIQEQTSASPAPALVIAAFPWRSTPRMGLPLTAGPVDSVNDSFKCAWLEDVPRVKFSILLSFGTLHFSVIPSAINF